jgi:hypothetical protein
MPGGMDWRTRNHRPVDIGPMSDVLRGVEIRMSRIAARFAGETRLTLSIGFGDMPTGTTLAAGVSRVYQHHGDTCHLCLVLDKETQLGKRPPCHSGALRLPERSPFRADALQIFQGDPAQGVCRSRNERLADTVIDVPPKGRFFPLGTLQGATDVLRTFGVHLGNMRSPLQVPAALRIACTAGFNRVTSMRLHIAGCRQIDHAQINTDEIRNRQACAVWKRDSHQQKPLAITAQHQVGLSMGEAKAFALVDAHEERHNDPTCERRDTDMVWSFEANVLAHRKGDGGMRAKGRRNRLVSFIRLDYLGNAADRGIGWQSKAFPQLVVCELLQLDLIGALLRKGDACQSCRSVVKALHDGLQGVSLCRIGQELEL